MHLSDIDVIHYVIKIVLVLSDMSETGRLHKILEDLLS
jgi:hypothetical protein